jgi:hypothetical protein
MSRRQSLRRRPVTEVFYQRDNKNHTPMILPRKHYYEKNEKNFNLCEWGTRCAIF